jgi:subtilase family serine protease
MFCQNAILRLFSGLCLLGIMGTCPIFGADWKILTGHVPAVTRQLKATGRLPATNELRLAIGVPLRDPAGLEKFLAAVNDPASPNYHHFLTPEEFTARFGATAADYAAVKNFARTNGFTITGEHGNRLLLEVTGRAVDVERAFHFSLWQFPHPAGARKFFAPDAEPTVAADLPVADIQGLSDYARPRPRSHRMYAHPVTMPQSGSAPNGSGAYFGADFRNAYATGSSLTGAGQSVGLVQFDGFYSNDIAAYASAAGGGRTNIVIQTILTDSYNGVPTTGSDSGNGEVSLDIEMAMAMAPGLAKIVVFEADPITGNQNTILAAMVTNTAIKQFSCSWGWSGGPSATTENYFQEMIAQGQSFFSASGDSDAFTTGASSVNGVDNTSLYNAPSSSPYITQVGGTTLTTGASAAYASETVWNWGLYNGSYVGSSGGISSYYSIPSWQTNLDMTASHGSTSFRNIPDVALTADNVYVNEGNGSTAVYGGTSCASPLWAGFMALVNQQLAINTGSATNSAGFINPAIYAIGKGANANFSYSVCFHDITLGNNYWSRSTTNFPAVTGFDLCTGWGTPTAGLITALAGVADPLGISPAAGGAFSGVAGGPFNPASTNLLLTNAGTSSLVWSLINTSAWLNVSATSGTLASGQFTNLTVRLTATASNLATGTYTVSLGFTNQTSHWVQTVPFSLQIFDALAVTPASGFTATGYYGGPFSITSQTYILTNLGDALLNWSINNTSSWLSVSGIAGTLAAGGAASVTVSLTAAATNLPTGTNFATVTFSNLTSGVGQTRVFGLQVQPPQLVTNGGFETGDFTGWTLADNTINTYFSTYNVVASSATPGVVYSGTYGAALGDTNLMSLSQTLATTPGQSYLLSLWLDNSTGGSGQQFVVNWNTNSPAVNTLFSWSGTNSFGWTNLLFAVSATGTNTVLQFRAMNPPYFFGLDDVNVMPVPAPAFTGFSGPSSGATNGFSFSWNTLAGVTYQVQYKTNLVQADWLTLSNFTATASSVNFTNFPGADPCRFYRVRSLP